MKKHISLTWLLTMAVNGAIADGVGLPTNVCHDFCGARQQRIWARFERGEGLDLAAPPSVYAGICHVFGDNINPDREHHVGFLIDHGAVGHGSPHKLRLRFSFFTSAQPYGELDAAQAEDYFGAPVLPLGVYQGYAYAEANSSRFPARYWFRRGHSPPTDAVRARVFSEWLLGEQRAERTEFQPADGRAATMLIGHASEEGGGQGAVHHPNNRPRKCLGMKTPNQALFGIPPSVALQG